MEIDRGMETREGAVARCVLILGAPSNLRSGRWRGELKDCKPQGSAGCSGGNVMDGLLYVL